MSLAKFRKPSLALLISLVLFYWTWEILNVYNTNDYAISYSLRKNISKTNTLISGNQTNIFDEIFSNSTFSEMDYDHQGNEHMSTSFYLWSQEPEKSNWSETQEMCSEILWPTSEQNQDTITKAKEWEIPYQHTDESVYELLSNCSRFRRLVPFAKISSTKREAQFPLAYVVVGARNAAQVVRFFRTIYQPQNAYCITYDNKSTDYYKKTLNQLPQCFAEEKNVFQNPDLENIYYADYSILHNVMGCMKILLNQWPKFSWKYVQIVSWNDFPLKTNLEMVKIFEILNSSQDSSLEPLLPHFFVYNWNFVNAHDVIAGMRKIAPYGLTMYKGSFATSMTKEFVEFVFANPASVKLYQWLNGSKCAEEHYFQTIIHNTQLNAPGSFPGQCLYFYQEYETTKPFVSRYQIWEWTKPETCRGKMVSLSCVYGVGDVKGLITRPELIAHKVYEEFEPATTFCMEQWFWNKSRNSNSDNSFDANYYENFPSVRYQRTKDKDEFVC